jgi:hypothetical protein
MLDCGEEDVEEANGGRDLIVIIIANAAASAAATSRDCGNRVYRDEVVGYGWYVFLGRLIETEFCGSVEGW